MLIDRQRRIGGYKALDLEHTPLDGEVNKYLNLRARYWNHVNVDLEQTHGYTRSVVRTPQYSPINHELNNVTNSFTEPTTTGITTKTFKLIPALGVRYDFGYTTPTHNLINFLFFDVGQ